MASESRSSARLGAARVLAAVLALSGLLATTAAQAYVAPGDPAPAFAAKALDGKHLDLAGLRGKIVIVNFWATWCPPCRAEMPVLEAFYTAHRDQGVEVVALSVDEQRDRKDVLRFMRTFSLPAALVASAETNDWPAPRVLPITYVIDAAGIVRDVLLPEKTPMSGARLEAAVGPVLAGSPSSGTAK